MNDSVLVEALRARDPGALVALYDAYAESIYRYCWSMVGTPDAAQVALRDTLIAAEAHIRELSDPDRLEVWLYALARGECVRRNLTMGLDPVAADPVFTGGGDADLRVMAWNATRSLSPRDREVLELACRHGLAVADLAAVLRVTAKTAGALYELARERLRDVVTAEVLVRKGPYDCVSRAQMLTGFSGELTPETRERVIRHVNRCDTCAPHRVRQVSAGKVFELLPVITLPETLRVRVMSCFADPELVPYRRYVARRVGLLDAAGFPADGFRRKRRRPYAMAGAAAAVAAVAAIALIFSQLPGAPGEVVVGVASGTPPVAAEPPGVRLPWAPGPDETPMTLEPVDGKVPVRPVGSTGSRGPIAVTRPAFDLDRRALGPVPTGRPAGNSPRPAGEPDGAPTGGSGDRTGEPAETPAEPSRPLDPAWPASPGPTRAGSPDGHHRVRDHQGGRHVSRRCAITPRSSGPRPRGSKPAWPSSRPASAGPRHPRNKAPGNPSRAHPRRETPRKPASARKIPKNPAPERPRHETPRRPANPNPDSPRPHLPNRNGKPAPDAPAPARPNPPRSAPAPTNPNPPQPNPQPPAPSDPPVPSERQTAPSAGQPDATPDPEPTT